MGARLLIDLGNTRLKWTTSRGARPDLEAVVAVSDWPSRLPDLVSSWRSLDLDEVVLAAVASAERTDVLLAGLGTLGLPLRLAVSEAQHGGLRCAYPEPAHLGVDRWMALLAAYRGDRHRRQLVVNAGSALVLDLLMPSGVHAGGLIAPGLTAMRDGLLRAAPGLAVHRSGLGTGDLATDSGAAIVNGCLQSALGLIERCRRMPAGRASCRVLLAGGDAERLHPWLRPPVRLRPHLVLEGLALWAQSP